MVLPLLVLPLRERLVLVALLAVKARGLLPPLVVVMVVLRRSPSGFVPWDLATPYLHGLEEEGRRCHRPWQFEEAAALEVSSRSPPRVAKAWRRS